AGTHYPCIADGAGRGIIEDISPYELSEYIEEINKTGLVLLLDCDGEEIQWDYRDFDLKYANTVLKAKINRIRRAYETDEE
ncbi:MAG: plasmid pRiA4b ORF-3 family protein, partial [Oscillospiraceae bacterium]|nr:plasmid pRiA4b ORF-3 family protein [Oscillospiraceae bacterium]